MPHRGGWGEIRTHEMVAHLPVFKTGAFNRSATHPKIQDYYTITYFFLKVKNFFNFFKKYFDKEKVNL